jgi:hypothetical protein
MKKVLSLICILAFMISFGACGGRAEKTDPATNAPGSAAGTQTEAPEGSLTLRLIDGAGTDLLVLAGEGSGDVYTVNAAALTLDAAPENGMLLTFGADIELLETWPMQISGQNVSAKVADAGKADHGDLCGLYLKVLEDLWTEDSGLNGDIVYVSVDLNDAPGGLTEGEKAAVTWVFSCRHNAQGLRLSFEELKAQGYVKTDELFWKDGLLFSIKAAAGARNSADKITFDAQKWRSGDGALFFNGCTAARGSGMQWDPYKPGSFAIA